MLTRPSVQCICVSVKAGCCPAAAPGMVGEMEGLQQLFLYGFVAGWFCAIDEPRRFSYLFGLRRRAGCGSLRLPWFPAVFLLTVPVFTMLTTLPLFERSLSSGSSPAPLGYLVALGLLGLLVLGLVGLHIALAYRKFGGCSLLHAAGMRATPACPPGPLLQHPLPPLSSRMTAPPWPVRRAVQPPVLDGLLPASLRSVRLLRPLPRCPYSGCHPRRQRRLLSPTPLVPPLPFSSLPFPRPPSPQAGATVSCVRGRWIAWLPTIGCAFDHPLSVKHRHRLWPKS